MSGGGLLHHDYTGPSRWLEKLYALPRPTANIEEWERSRHHDLPAMDSNELELEAHRIRHRLAYDPRPDAWLLERREAVGAERRRRWQAARGRR